LIPSSQISSLSPSPPVVPSHPTFSFHYTRRRRVVESSDVLSTSGAPSQPPYGLRIRPRPPPDFYSPSSFSVSDVSEPTTYREVVAHPEWQLAMAEEISALERTCTWEIVPLPPRVCPITCKWVYKVKTRSDGSLERYKARFVARGF
jgi:hypothetical protein